MYGIAGERRLPEWELPWLPGYEGSRPVRVGNAAHEQLQLDVYGEVMDALHQARPRGLAGRAPTPGSSQRALLEHLERIWQRARRGHLGGARRRRSTSRTPRSWPGSRSTAPSGAVETFGLDGPDRRLARRSATRIHAEVCAHGFDATRGTFVQAYGSTELDASLLLHAARRLPARRTTARARHRRGDRARLVARRLRACATTSTHTEDGLPPGEGAFLACSFWLADNYVLLGRRDEARRAVRAAAGAAQRRRPARRGIRPGALSPGGELSAGILPRRAA